MKFITAENQDPYIVARFSVDVFAGQMASYIIEQVLLYDAIFGYLA